MENNRKRSFYFNLLWAAILLLAGNGIWSCSDEAVNYFDEENVLKNAALAQTEPYDALEVDYLIEAAFKSRNVLGLNDGCIFFSADTTTHAGDGSAKSRRLTLDFSEGCTGPFPFNRARSGKILVDYPTFLGDTLSRRVITFDNYFVSNQKIEGEIDLDSVARGADTFIHSVVTFKDLKVSFPTGTYVVLNGRQHRMWVSGENDLFKNTYTITDSNEPVTGTASNDHSFKSNISKQMFLSYPCANDGYYAAVSGTITLPEVSGYPARTRNVDFGDLHCDHNISIATFRRTYVVSVN